MIKDFDPTENDKLKISGFGTNLDEFSELIANDKVTVVGSDTTIDLTSFGGGTILLEDFVGLAAEDVMLIA